jgi:cellulose synthase/poly-beta-1,6-N-acetylglucosamine synthase-like glycosyltransferase
MFLRRPIPQQDLNGTAATSFSLWLDERELYTGPKLSAHEVRRRMTTAPLDLHAASLANVPVPGRVSIVFTVTGWTTDEARATLIALQEAEAIDAGVVLVQNDICAHEATLAFKPPVHLAARLHKVLTLNNGFAAACNAGANAASRWRNSDWVLFTQRDASWTAASIRSAVSLATSVQGKCSFPAVVGPSGGTWSGDCTFKERGRNIGQRFSHAELVDFVTGYWLLVHRAALRAIGGWSEDFFLYCEDPDLCFRLALVGCFSVVCASVEVDHVRGSTIRTVLPNVVREEIHKHSRHVFMRRWCNG